MTGIEASEPYSVVHSLSPANITGFFCSPLSLQSSYFFHSLSQVCTGQNLGRPVCDIPLACQVRSQTFPGGGIDFHVGGVCVWGGGGGGDACKYRSENSLL